MYVLLHIITIYHYQIIILLLLLLLTSAAAADDDDDDYDYFCSSLLQYDLILLYVVLWRYYAYSDIQIPRVPEIERSRRLFLIEPGQDTWREILHQLVGKIPV